jgi:hypothetical protein
LSGSTENAILVNDLLAGLRERGLDVTYLILVVREGPRRCAAWCSTPCCGHGQPSKQFRRISGHLHLHVRRRAHQRQSTTDSV